MGRFYSGDIEGKFWFGIQSSNDIENLIHIVPQQSYIWKDCGCMVEDINNHVYCSDCYNSKEEHETGAIEDEDFDENNNELYIEEQSISYTIDKEEHYGELIKTLDNLKLKLHKDILNSFDKIEQNDKILNAFEGIFDNSVSCLNKIQIETNDNLRNHSEILARYTLGYQIKYCLEQNDTCYVICEC